MSIFNKIQLKKPKRSVFNLSYSSKLSLPFGKLVPIMCEKVVPGDKFVHSHEFIMRFAPFFGQVFQQYKVVVDYFFVPSRLLWRDFENFLVDNDNLYPHPYIVMSRLYNGTDSMQGSLCDYFNLPTGNTRNPLNPAANTGANLRLDVLPFSAYLKIFLDYYADENLTQFLSSGTEYNFEKILDLFDDLTEKSGLTYSTDLYRLFSLINRGVYPSSSTISNFVTFPTWFPFTKAYPKDYFTSALPFAQRGPIVQIPLNGSGDVTIRGDMDTNRAFAGIGIKYNPSQQGVIENGVDVTLFPTGMLSVEDSSPVDVREIDPSIQNKGYVVSGFQDDSDVSDPVAAAARVKQLATGKPLSFRAVNVNGTATITDLRTAMVVQSWLEKNARAGVRYKEQLMSHFGVRSKDYRLQRAELLQRSKSTVSIGEVFTTAQDDSGDFLPGLGVSTATGSNAVRPFKHYFEEHGYVIGLMCVYPTAAYSQGVPAQFRELDKFDYYWPEFQHIGEQDIKKSEVFYSDGLDAGSNDSVFGYTPRYAQYKTRLNQIHGDFRDQLKFMTSSREFQNAPILNKSFIDILPDENNLYRVFNATGDYANAFPCFCDFFHNFKAIRPMSYFGNPRII